MSLSVKFILIVLFVVVLTTISSVIGIRITSRTSDLLLYQALQGSLTYTAKDISKKLSSIEALSGTIINSQTIYKNLSAVSEKPDSELKITNSKNAIESELVDLYQNYKENNITNIYIYSGSFTAQSYPYLTQTIPDFLYHEIIDSAEARSGYPVWITDYCNTNGLFLARTVRQVKNHAITDLGTAVVSIDFDKLVKSSANSVLDNEALSYVFFKNGNEIYHSKDVTDQNLVFLKSLDFNGYRVLSMNSHKFFAVNGTVPNFDLSYICLIPYDSVINAQHISQLNYFFIILLAAACSILLSRFLVHSISKDVQNLVNKMDAFGKNENIEIRNISDYSERKDEIGRLNNQFDIMAKNMQMLIQENYVNTILTKDAQIKALESQINPHFLYNTLESVNWRAKAIGEKDISKMTEALGTLLRATLSKDKKPHTISEELNFVNSYITIQSIRFSDRLHYTQSVPEDMSDIEIPKLTIQPLVENAINYSMENSMDVCEINISGKAENNAAIIDVSNNGSQFEDNLLAKLESGEIKPNGFGVGLSNINRRLQLMYGNEYGLSFFNPDENTAVARICIPATRDIKQDMKEGAS